jgi:hypothetical protein
MRIPNKFNGYMSDGRRLYPDPATSIIFAKALATAGGTATAAAVPTVAAAALPTLAAPVATTAAANLGTTAALEASKQGIIQAGAQQAGAEAAKQAGVEAAKQVAQEGAKQATQEVAKEGVKQVGQEAAQKVTEESIKNGLNNVNNMTANLNNSGIMTDAGMQNVAPEILAPKPGVTDAQVQSMVNQLNTPKPPSPYELTGKTPDFLANAPSPTNADLIGQGINTNPASYNVADAAKTIPKDVVGNPSLKMPGMEPLTTAKPPPNALERGFSAATKFASDHPYITAGGIMLAQNMSQPSAPAKKKYSRSGESNFKYTEPSTGEYTPIFEPTDYAKEGGLMGYAVGGPVETMSAQNAISGNMMYPQSQLHTPMYSNPMTSRPMPTNIINSGIDAPTNAYSGEPRYASGGKTNAFEKMMQEDETRRKREAAQAKSDLDQEARSLASRTKPYSRTQSTNSPYAAAVKELQGLGKKYGIQMAAPTKTNVDLMGDQDQIEYAANGGIMHGLGGYSDGGRLLKGPGDGVSDSIPAVIGNKQPARLADGEFVIPARIVSELGNGSTEAGARKLYAMMERIQKQRGKTVGKGKVAVNSKASKHLPA